MYLSISLPLLKFSFHFHLVCCPLFDQHNNLHSYILFYHTLTLYCHRWASIPSVVFQAAGLIVLDNICSGNNFRFQILWSCWKVCCRLWWLTWGQMLRALSRLVLLQCLIWMEVRQRFSEEQDKHCFARNGNHKFVFEWSFVCCYSNFQVFKYFKNLI